MKNIKRVQIFAVQTLIKLSLCIIIYTSGDVFAQAPKYSNDFLTIGIGAESLALGNATVSSVSDVTSVFWNPAGLTKLSRQFDVGLMHSEYFSGLAKFDYFGIAYNTNNQNVIGFSIIRFGVDDIPNTLDLYDSQGNPDYNRIKYFGIADYAFLLSYAKNSAIQGLSYGANAKIIYRHEGEFADAYGFGLDLGLQYQRNKWKYGLIARNITTTFNVWIFNTSALEDVFQQTGNEIPENSIELTLPTLTTGISREFRISSTLKLNTELDLEFYFDGKRNALLSSKFGNIYPMFGSSLAYQDYAFLRFGVNQFQRVKDFGKEKIQFQPSAGIGIRIFRFYLDYAITNIGEVSGTPYSNIFSIRWSFNK